MSFQDISLICIFVSPVIWCCLPQQRADKIKSFIREHKILKGILVLLALAIIIGSIYMAGHDDLTMSEWRGPL